MRSLTRRVLLLTDKFLPERGGSQVLLGKTYAGISDWSVTVLTRRWPGAAEFDSTYPHPIVRVPYPDLPKVRMPALWCALAMAASRRSSTWDEIHAGQVLETGLAARWLAGRRRARYLVHTYGEELRVYGAHPTTRRWMQQVLRDAAGVTACSRSTLELVLELGVPPERARLIYPGAELPSRARGREEIRSAYDLGEGPVLITVGRLTPRKGQDTVLAALPRLVTRFPSLRYLILGAGPDAGRLRNLSRELGLECRVKFVDGVSDQERSDLLHASDLFVMPNRRLPNGDSEGFGIVFLEAGLAGLPVIGGRDGGAVEAIEDGVTGLLVEPNSPGAVVEAVQSLLENPENCRRLGTAGRERAASGFTWAETSRQFRRFAEPGDGGNLS